MRAILVAGLLCALSGGCGGEEEAPAGGAEPSAAPAAAGCKNDNECKGERVCVKGECVDPAAQAPAPPPAPAPAPTPALTPAPAPAPIAGDPCSALPGEYCKACGDASPACTGWTKYFANAQIFAGYPKEACKGMIDSMAIVMQTQKEATCAKDPSIHLPGGGAPAAAPPPAAPAAPVAPDALAAPAAPPAAGGAPCAVAGTPKLSGDLFDDLTSTFKRTLAKTAPKLAACGTATGTVVISAGVSYDMEMKAFSKIASNDNVDGKVADCIKKEIKKVADRTKYVPTGDVFTYTAKITVVCGAPP